jgi:hypothetical protein
MPTAEERQALLIGGAALLGLAGYQALKSRGPKGAPGPSGPPGTLPCVTVDPIKFRCAPPLVWNGRACVPPGTAPSSSQCLTADTFNCLPGLVWNGADCVPVGAPPPPAPAQPPAPGCGYTPARVAPSKFQCIPGYGWTGRECRPLNRLQDTGCGLDPATFQCLPGLAWNGTDCVPTGLAGTGSSGLKAVSRWQDVVAGWIIATDCRLGTANYLIEPAGIGLDLLPYGYEPAHRRRRWIADQLTWNKLGVPRSVIRIVTPAVLASIAPGPDLRWAPTTRGTWVWLNGAPRIPPMTTAAGYC